MEMVEVVVEEEEVVELLLLEMSINYDTLHISILIIIWNSIMKYNNYLVCQQQKKGIMVVML